MAELVMKYKEGEHLMKKYLRFGEIPPNEKSINWIMASLDASHDFSYSLELGDTYEEAYRFAGIKEEWLEDGVSVFEFKDGSLVFNDNLKADYEYRVAHIEKSYIVTGDEVGRGKSGEPLLKNIKILKEVKIS